MKLLQIVMEGVIIHVIMDALALVKVIAGGVVAEIAKAIAWVVVKTLVTALVLAIVGLVVIINVSFLTLKLYGPNNKGCFKLAI